LGKRNVWLFLNLHALKFYNSSSINLLQKNTASLKGLYTLKRDSFKDSTIPEQTANHGPKPPMASQRWLGYLIW